ncbi:MAG: PIG-L family deacetylase [Ilumatobacteraceae bacterium]
MIDGLAPGWADVIASARAWQPPLVPTLVAVPHPDDESLSTGGLIAHLRRHDVAVVVVAVTDGGSAYPGQITANDLAYIRRNEQRRALEHLSVPSGDIWRVGVADGGVAAAESTVSGMIECAARQYSIGHIVAPWVRDHHTDHEAVGRAAEAAASALGVSITFGLFWGLYHSAAPGPTEFEPYLLALTDEERRSKWLAIESHESQLTASVASPPVLDRRLLDVAARPFELFLSRCDA